MKVSAKSGGGDFKILDSGTHTAVCDMIVGIGPQAIEYKGKTKEQEKVKLRFQVPAERAEWQDKDGNDVEGPMVIWATYTASLSDRANLRRDLEAWRGRAFTPEELNGFELNNVLGKPCMLSVAHREYDGKTYANITSIAKLMKGIPEPKAEGDLVTFDFWNHTQEQFDALPEWLQEKVSDGKKLADEQVARVGAPKEPGAEPDGGFVEDDIPF